MLKITFSRLKKSPTLFIWVSLILLFVFSTTYLSFKFFNNLAKEDEFSNLYQQGLLISSVVNHENIGELNGNISDTIHPYYQKLKRQFVTFCNQLPSIRYIYTLGKQNEKLFFYIDTESDNNKSKSLRKTAFPGEIYSDAPKEMDLVFSDKSPRTTEPYSDQWGEFITIIIPIVNNQNKVVAITCFDIDVTYWDTLIQTKSIFPFATSLLFILLIVFAIIFLKLRIDKYQLLKEDSSRFYSYFMSNKDATIFISLNLKVLFFNKSAISIGKLLFDKPLKIGENVSELLKNTKHKQIFIENTQNLISKNKIKIELEIQNQIYSITYKIIQPTENDTPFISIHIKNATTQFSIKHKNIIQQTEQNNLKRHYRFFSITTDSKFTIESIGSDFKTITGNSIYDIKGKSMLDIIHPSCHSIFESLTIANTLPTNDSIETTLLFENTLTPNTTFQTIISKCFFKNQKQVYVFTCIDPTYSKNAELTSLLSNIPKTSQTLDNLPGFVYSSKIGKQPIITYVSSGFERITGYPINDLLENNRLSYTDIILPSHRKQILEKWEESIQSHSLFDAEYEILTAIGTHRWVWEQGLCFYDNDENAIEIQSYVIDVTNIKKNIEFYTQENKSLKQFIDNAPQGFLQIDNTTSIIRTNLSIANILEFETDELKTLTLNKLVHPTSLNTYTAFIKTLFDTNFASADLNLITKDFKNRYVNIEAKKHNNNEYILYIIDKTKEKTDYNYLFSKFKIANDIITNIEIPILIFNYTTFSIECLNSKLESAFLDKIFESIGFNNYTKDITPSSLLHKSISQKTIVADKYFNINDSNQIKHYIIYLIPIEKQEKIDNILIYVIDHSDCIIQQDELESKIQKLKSTLISKSDWFSSSFNQIRLVLNTIVGTSDSLLHKCKDPYMSEISFIKESSIDAIDKISTFLNNTKVDSTISEINFEQFNAENILFSIVLTNAPICESKGIQLITHIQLDLLNDIISDEIIIRETIQIITQKIIENTNSGYVKINLTIQNKFSNYWLDISISNTSTPNSASEIVNTDIETFEPEIWKCKNLLEPLNGIIAVNPNEENGIITNISIPIAFAESNPKRKNSSLFNNSTLLLVSSSEFEIDSIKQLLTKTKSIILTSTNGIEAIQIATQKSKENVQIDILMIDFSINGILSVDAINTIQVLHKNITICVLSKHSDIEKAKSTYSNKPEVSVLTTPVLPSFLYQIKKSNSKKTDSKNSTIHFATLPKKSTVLIAEDNPVNMLMLKEILMMSDATIVEAINGQEAYLKYLEHRPNLIFMDIHMPVLDGIESTSLIIDHCQKNPNYNSPYIIALTANNSQNLKNNYTALGFSDFISKPYKISDVQDCLTKYISNAKSI